MTEEIQLRFEQAAECVEDAQVLLDHDRLAAAVTRAYYAMFHAATAVLLARGIKRSSHRGMLSAFGEHVVKPGAIDRTFFQHLRDAFERRQQSDYEPMIEIDRNTVVQKAPECGRLHRRLPQTRQLTTDNCLLTTKLTKTSPPTTINQQPATDFSLATAFSPQIHADGRRFSFDSRTGRVYNLTGKTMKGNVHEALGNHENVVERPGRYP